MTYELDASYQPIRKYLVGLGIDNYEGHLEYSEITDWPHIFDANYNQPWYSYMKDQVGTIYKLYSLKTRSLVDNRTYDSFGNLIAQTGTTKTPLGFQGKYYDQESGLNYFYHRYYNPAIGRFTSEDPIGMNGGLNLNSFVGSNPITFTDKFGLERDWSSEMPNGGGWSQMGGGEFTALFGGSPAEIIKWTIDGIASKPTGCCVGKFLKCMFVPDLNDLLSTLDSVFSIWEKTGWIYGPPNVGSSLYLGATAVMTEWKWYKFTGTTAKILGSVAVGLSVYTYIDCWLKMKKCMEW